MASEISRLYDFQPGSRASSDQVDSEFNQLVTAYNTLNGEIIALISLLDSATGATTIGATPVPDLNGSTVQALIESIRNKLKSITDGDSGADFIGSTPLKAGGSSTVQGQLKELYVEEPLRVTAENIRKSNEQERVTAENIGKSNETARITAEDTRQDNEEARQEADILRGQTVEAIEQHYAPRLTTVEGQINDLDAQKAEKTEVNATNLRIDNLVIPISPENVNIEVTDAHNSIVKDKNFASLKDRFEENEQDLVQHKLDYATQIEKALYPYKTNGGTLPWEIGRLDHTTGMPVVSTTRIRTSNYIKNIDKVTLSDTTNYKMVVFSFLDDYSIVDMSGWIQEDYIVDSTHHIKVHIARVDDSAINTSDIPSISSLVNFHAIEKDIDDGSITLSKLSKDISGLNNYSTVPTFTDGVLTKVEELDGVTVKKRTTISYNADNTVNTVTDEFLGKTVISTMHYVDGKFAFISKQLIEGGL